VTPPRGDDKAVMGLHLEHPGAISGTPERGSPTRRVCAQLVCRSG
jgi:hypothetical protein